MWLILVGIVLTCQSFIDLEIVIPLPFKTLNVPISDALACVLFPLAFIGSKGTLWRRFELRGFALVLLALLVGTTNALVPAESLYTWLRKPVFMAVSYGMVLVWVLHNRIQENSLCRTLLLWQASTGGLLLANGIGRLIAGEALWWQSIAGITPNHKALAVSLCGILPLFWAKRDTMTQSLPGTYKRHFFHAIQALVLVAIFLSFSKTAWLIVAFSIGWFWPREKPVSRRPVLIAALGIAGVWLMIQLPFLLDSRVMIDALRSRHSINLRVLDMFWAHPFIGMGTATNLHYELVTFPHYRINGVDAHGMIQKLASEGGLLALCGLGIFFKDGRNRLITKDPNLLGAYWALFLCALLSTEFLHSTWWIPFAVLMGWPQKEAGNSDQISSTSSTGQ